MIEKFEYLMASIDSSNLLRQRCLSFYGHDNFTGNQLNSTLSERFALMLQ
jgi:hypothetical protein